MRVNASPPSEFHRHRRAAILSRRPELKYLFGRCPSVAAVAVMLVAAQYAAAVGLARAPLWQVLVGAVLVGAFISHGLNVVIHEATHNLVLRGTALNKAVAILANLPALVPSAMGFRHYHLLHHRCLGEPRMDADVALPWEIRLVGASRGRKFVWLVLLPVVYGLVHPLQVRKRLPLDGWLAANLFFVVGAAILVGIYLGSLSLLYLAVSTYLAVGPHPTGAHILQEHINFAGRSYETASYYGPVNAVSLNHGYHLEHHDFANVPGPRLHHVRRLAPEFYDARFAHASRLMSLWQFVFDRRISLGSRIVADIDR